MQIAALANYKKNDAAPDIFFIKRRNFLVSRKWKISMNELLISLSLNRFCFLQKLENVKEKARKTFFFHLCNF